MPCMWTSFHVFIHPHVCDLFRFLELVGRKFRTWVITKKKNYLCRFDGLEFLRRYKGKSIMFVGDSLSRNQWLSLICMLYTAVPRPSYHETTSAEVSTFTFTVSTISYKFSWKYFFALNFSSLILKTRIPDCVSYLILYSQKKKKNEILIAFDNRSPLYSKYMLYHYCSAKVVISLRLH